MSDNCTDALIIFAKWPEPGRVKTRLTPPLTHEEAAELYRCMLFDTLNATAGFPGINRLIFFDGPAERATDFGAMAPDAQIFRQDGTDLGERLTDAFEKAFSHGFRNVAVIGTDAPHMPQDRVSQAFSLLNSGNADVVFGPTDDGGYYLLAQNKPHNGLFHDIPWSSPDVLKVSLYRAESAALRVSLLAEGYDLDSHEDLRRFWADITAATRAQETAALISRLITT